MEPHFTPAYYQIKQDVKKRIADGLLKPGELLPGRAQLTTEYNCSWSTLNRAINELMLEGILVAQKGVGTFVAHQQPANETARQPVKVWVCHPFPSIYSAFSEMMDGLREEAHRRGKSIQFIDKGNEEKPKDLSGYIVVTPSNDQFEELERAWNEGQRFVVLNSDFKEASFVCINSDLYRASVEVMDTLMDNGHRSIGLLGVRHRFSNYENRMAAFREGFRKRNVPFLEEWIVGRPEDQDDAKHLFAEWLENHSDCTAVYAADYTSSLILLEILCENGVRIPQQLSLFASGPIPFQSVLKVPLDVVLQPFHELGRIAVAKLLDEQWDAGTILLPCRLQKNGSVSEAPSAII